MGCRYGHKHDSCYLFYFVYIFTYHLFKCFFLLFLLFFEILCNNFQETRHGQWVSYLILRGMTIKMMIEARTLFGMRKLHKCLCTIFIFYFIIIIVVVVGGGGVIINVNSIFSVEMMI